MEVEDWKNYRNIATEQKREGDWAMEEDKFELAVKFYSGAKSLLETAVATDKQMDIKETHVSPSVRDHYRRMENFLREVRTLEEIAEEEWCLSQLQKIEWRDFEHFIADLWREEGWEARVTPPSGDGGIDVIATNNTLVPRNMLYKQRDMEKTHWSMRNRFSGILPSLTGMMWMW